MTSLPSSLQITSYMHAPKSLTSELRVKAKAELEASFRRDQALGILAAGQVPWQILLASFLQEPNREDEIGQLAETASKFRFSDRWLFALQDAGMIQVDSNRRFGITALGIEAVERCLGD